MKEYAAHWQLALLGAEFWNDVETRNQPIHDLIDTVHDQTLHTRFPFNLVSEENSRARSLTAGAGAGSAGDRAPSPDVVDSNNTSSDSSDKPRRRRCYSMSDVFTRSTASNTPELTLTMAGSRKAERAKRSRSESRTRSQEQQTPQQQPQPFSRSSSTASNRNNQSTASLLRSALQRLSRKRMGSGEEQMPTPVNSETAAAGEVGHRSHPQAQQQAQQVQQAQAQAQSLPIVFFTAEQATPTNPLLEFRGGATWARFPRNRRSLGIDVYLPIDKSQSATATNAAADSTAQTEKQTNGEEEEEEEDEDEDEEEVEERVEVLPVEQLFPLIHFRHLRSLKITGMVQSYQRYIWQATWLNTGLEELELSMVCPPRLRQSFAGNWPYIKGGWTMNPTHYSAPVYYGTGAGALPRTIGEGEYLDKIALEKAKICAMVQGPTRNRLSIRTLTLTGFVVDADPFLLWFDATRLKCLHFKDYCVDAGFYLCEAMHRVSVLYPRLLLVDEEGREAVVARRVNLRKELKVVQLRGGRKVGEMASTGPGCLDRKIPEAVGVGVGGAGQEEEEEEGAEGADAAAAAAPAPASATE